MVALHLGKAPGRELTHLISDLRIRIVDSLQGLPEILVFGAYQRQIELIKRSSLALHRCQMRMSHIRGASAAMITILSGIAFLSALYLAVNLVYSESLNGATLALVILTVMASFEAILPLPLAFQHLGQTREAGHRLLEIVEADPEVIFPDQSSCLSTEWSVSFESVNFRYHDQAPWALTDVDLQIPAGRRVAVIGETGSGKSTLTHLLARFWNPHSGAIRLGEEDICNFSEQDLRRLISIVSQQPHMFNATLEENLLIASPGSGKEDLRAALQTAQLSEFVKQLPDGLQTWLGESGQLVSGGQARRIAVARAILHNGPIWVLDEPTEGLDPITEKEMMQALNLRTTGKTLLLITHRLADLEWMDQIVMLDQGRVIDRGSHAELLSNNERYAALHKRIA
jgi:ATP-binding cassette subfamily C protein CydC